MTSEMNSEIKLSRNYLLLYTIEREIPRHIYSRDIFMVQLTRYPFATLYRIVLEQSSLISPI